MSLDFKTADLHLFERPTGRRLEADMVMSEPAKTGSRSGVGKARTIAGFAQ